MIYKNLKIKYKLRLVAFSQLVISILLLGFIFVLINKLNSNVNNILSTNKKITLLRNTTLDIKDYFAGETSFETIQNEIQ